MKLLCSEFKPSFDQLVTKKAVPTDISTIENNNLKMFNFYSTIIFSGQNSLFFKLFFGIYNSDKCF
jgi:hypothetical protein